VEESPLHAFELHDLIPLVPAGVDISINKAVILMWVIVGAGGVPDDLGCGGP
jgi:F-type H+-transporting ATPase subunit a